MRRIITFIILLAVVFLYTRPFFRAGYFPTHDGEWAIVRLAEMVREVKDLQFPPRWSDYLNHGFGYPLFSFTYPLPYYFGTILHLLGFGLTDSVKILFVGSVVFSGIFMYLLGKEITGEYGGLISAAFYIASPFRLVNLYARGSLGESLNSAVFPLLCYLSILCIKKFDNTRLVLCSITLAFLILTHNITALIFFPIWIIFIIASGRFYKLKFRKLSRIFLPVIILGLGLSAYFFLPALLEKRYIILSQLKLANVSENFVSPADYLSAGFRYDNLPSFGLGIANILGFIASLLLFSLNKSIRKKYGVFIIFIITVFGTLIFLTNSVSSSLWNVIPLAWIDFPWRLITPIMFLLSFSAIFLALSYKSRVIGIILVILALIFNLKYARPKEYFFKPDAYYAANDATTTSMDELMPIWVKVKPKNRYQNKIEILKGEAEIKDLTYNSKEMSFSLLASSPSSLSINTIYFPGWQLKANNQTIPFNIINTSGTILFNTLAGTYKITANFNETPLRLVSDIISIIAFIYVIFILSKKLR